MKTMDNSKKGFKKEMNKLVRTLLCYEAAMMLTVLVYAVVMVVMNQQLSQAQLNTRMMGSGLSSIIGILIGLLFVIGYRKKRFFTHDLSAVNNKMNAKVFIGLFVCFMAPQFLANVVSLVVESGLNSFGYTIFEQYSEASSTSTTVSMFLYAAILGPLAEELVFRGMVLRTLEKYGKVFAIVVSAVLFGCFHANLIQGLFAGLVGIVLGYVTLKYSLKWAVLFHVLNNLIFSEVLGALLSGFSPTIQSVIWWVVTFAFFIAGAGYLFTQREQIRMYCSKYKIPKQYIKYTVTSIWLVLFVVLNMLLALDGINRL